MRLPYSNPFCLSTSLDAQTVSERLKSGLSRDGVPATSRVKGWVSADGCVLKGPIPDGMGNSFRRRLEIHFYPSTEGTELRGRFRLSWPAFYFMCFWFGFLLLSVPATALAMITQRDSSNEPALIVFIALFVLGFGLTEFGVWMSRSSEEKVVEFLHEVLG